MTDFKSFRTNLKEKKGLWDNIHAKRKRGEKPNPPGHPDRPTAQDFKDAQKKESLDISEISLDMLTKKISNSGMDTTKKANKMDKTKNDLAALRARLAGKPAMAKESVELDEAVHTVEIDHEGDQDHDAFKHKITLKHGRGAGDTTATGKKKNLQKYLTKHYSGRDYAKDVHPEVFESVDLSEFTQEELIDFMMTEDFAQLDELSKKTLGSYIKKADKQANKAADSYSNAAMRRHDFAPDTPAMAKNAKKFAKRDAGADLARRKLAKEAYEDDEPASPDEASMAMRQLGFIEYAAEEVMDHIKSGKEFPEWMQNKLSKLHGQMESLHSALGDHGEDDDEMKEAADIEEARRKGAPKMTGDSFAMQRTKDAALNKALGRTKTGRKKPERTMTSTQRSLASLRNEGINTADRKPEKFVKPDGKVGIRMVPVNKQIVDKDA